MLFSGAGVEHVEHLLGEFACALEARRECRGLPGWLLDDPLRLRFEAAALEPAELELLRRAPAAELTQSPGELARLSIPAAVLEELALRSPAARALLAAARAAGARPAAPRLMGILNVTPDSFSDGGVHLDPARAVAQGRALIEAGAELVDVGGESTRPGAEPVPAELELERVLPVLGALADDGRATLSIDTTKARVAAAALGCGARVVNDVSAGRADADMFALVAARGAAMVLMHAQGSPRDMQLRPAYTDVVREVLACLRTQARRAWQAGIEPARLALDPGIGFGKRLEHNLALLSALPELRSAGLPLVVGTSRKSFLGTLTGEPVPARRDGASAAMTALAAYLGAEVHRVHAPAGARAALSVARALSDPWEA